MVTRPNGQAVMLVDAGDYESLMETVHLVRVPANAERLLKGAEQYRQGQVYAFDEKSVTVIQCRFHYQ